MPPVTPSSKPHPAGASKPAVAAPAAPAAPVRTKNWLLIGGGAAALVIVVTALIIWQKVTAPPRLNDSTLEITKFAASARFDKLPFSEQKKFMFKLEERKDEVKSAYHAGKLDEVEFRTAKELAWFGDWLGKMDEYYAKPPGQQRQLYLERLVAKREKKDDNDNKKPSSKKPADEHKLPKVERDESSETIRPESWPAEDKQRWLQFRSALSEVKDAQDKAEKAAKEAAARNRQGSTKPAGG
jgi:hypothetical protein